MRWVLALLLFSLTLFGGEFETLMGKEAPEWIYVSKQEDMMALEQFEALFEKNKHHQFAREGDAKIPRTIHFVWLGPEDPSKENIRSWVEAHPDWKGILWSDRYMDVTDFSIEWKDVSSFPFLFSRKQYEAAQSWEEKAEILSLEILYQEGGLMVDLRSRCLKRFDGLHKGFDFYCGLNLPHPPDWRTEHFSGQRGDGGPPLSPGDWEDGPFQVAPFCRPPPLMLRRGWQCGYCLPITLFFVR